VFLLLGCGHAQVVKALLASGATTDVRDKEKMRPVDLSKSYKEGQWEETVQLLS